jgi:hypothetical protein
MNPGGEIMKVMVTLLAIVLLLAACTAPEPSTTTDTASEPTAAGSEGTSPEDLAAEESDTLADVEETNAPSENTGNDNDAFKNFFKARTLEYHVDYDVMMSAEGQETTSEMSFYLKNNNFRNDFSGNMDGEVFTSRNYHVDGQISICNEAEGTWTCMQFDQPQESEGIDITANMDELEESLEDIDMIQKGTKTIAGTKATCWEYSAEGMTQEHCYSKAGVPLYMEITGDNFHAIYEASSYSTSVANSAFDLPAKPMDLSNLENMDPAALAEMMGN